MSAAESRREPRLNAFVGRSDVFAQEQAEALLASLPTPSKCDGCGKPLEDATRERHPYGPFTLHVCPGCKLIFCRLRLRAEAGQ